MLYKQTASPMHDVCLDLRSFKCKIGKNCCDFFYSFRGKISDFKFPSTPREERFYCYPARYVSIMFGKQCVTKFPMSNIHNRHVDYVNV